MMMNESEKQIDMIIMIMMSESKRQTDGQTENRVKTKIAVCEAASLYQVLPFFRGPTASQPHAAHVGHADALAGRQHTTAG